MISKFTTYRYKVGALTKFEVPIIFDTESYEMLKQKIAKSKYRCVIIVSQSNQFLNLITQGDVIRFELSSQNHQLKDLLSKKSVCKVAVNSSTASQISIQEDLSVVPIQKLDGAFGGVLVRSFESSDLKSDNNCKKRLAIIMAGGKGTRLGKLTELTPKPLLKIKNRPLIEYVMSSIEFLGFKDFYLLCGHMVENFHKFSVDTNFQVTICSEETPLGTGGPFIKWIHDNTSYISEMLDQYDMIHLLIANGDLLFDLDSDSFTKFEDSDVKIAIVGRRIETEIKYGTMELNADGNLSDFVEKPVIKHMVNTGVYFISLDENMFTFIKNLTIRSIGMPDLLQTISKAIGSKISVVEVSGNYIDMGTAEDLSAVTTALEGK